MSFKTTRGIGGHQRSQGATDEWLTPPDLILALGAFDLDPCSPVDRPWDTAREHYTILDNGLAKRWAGRVWLNPPYGPQTGLWVEKLARHGDGMALIFARTETSFFHRWVWGVADGLLFLRRRVTFCDANGIPGRYTGGAPSVLVAYGAGNARWLIASGLDGAYVPGTGIQILPKAEGLL